MANDDHVALFTKGVAAWNAWRDAPTFTGWKKHDSYQESFDRLMRDLRVENAEQ
jgi:hypothetical protein